MNETSKRRAMHRIIRSAAVLAVCIALLSGCLYPKDQRDQQIAAKESVMIVQKAVERFKEEREVLPIKNSSPDTPLYEKFVIDFSKLIQFHYLSSIPTSAFERGGSAYFLIINEETKPEVKLMDLVTFQSVAKVQKAVDRYYDAHGKLPYGEQAVPEFYWIDYEALRERSPDLRSVYSGQTLNLIMHESGQVFVDYSIDIMQTLTRLNLDQVDPRVDLRTLLVNESYYVPVKSCPYYWVNGEPHIVFESSK